MSDAFGPRGSSTRPPTTTSAQFCEAVRFRPRNEGLKFSFWPRCQKRAPTVASALNLLLLIRRYPSFEVQTNCPTRTSAEVALRLGNGNALLSESRIHSKSPV